VSGRVLCVDYGTVRIGLAVSDPLGSMAQPLDVMTAEGDPVEAIASRARALHVSDIVVGLPLRTTGESGPEAEAVREFARLLGEASGIAVHLWDERLSSVEAERLMQAQGVDSRKRRGRVDKVAAAIVLQSYLDSRQNR
jgi:putative Holliday junction resolvase